MIANAAEASSLGSSIEVRITQSWLRWNGRPIPAARITIADRGYGISRHTLGHIFERFFTTKNDVGTDLGLWGVKEIVSKHQGRIQVRSKKSSGTVFSILHPKMEVPPQE